MAILVYRPYRFVNLEELEILVGIKNSKDSFISHKNSHNCLAVA